MSEHRRRPLTPHEIRNLRISRIGLRKGYDPAAVHELLQRLAEETASRDAMISDLSSRLHRAEAEVYARRHGVLPAAPEGSQLAEMLAEIDVAMKAQRQADELIAAAQQGAAQIVQQGRQQASQILEQAHRAADEAARSYRAQAGAGYDPDREELARLLGLAQWAQAQLAELHQQITATDARVSTELGTIIERLRPAIESEQRQTAVGG
jgi:cell division septum initiation protein DivIVA